MLSAKNLRPLPPAIIFLLFFSYATAAALLFQKFLLPLVASAHHGQGLVEGDSAYFHAVAVDLAERIRLHGWSEWHIYPAQGATGNVALLAALYVLFGVDPSLMVPVNAALHALTGTLLFLLGRRLWPGRTGTLAGMIAGTLYITFPSALNWYGQIHKDGFALAGTALVLTAWVLTEEEQPGRRQVPLVIVTLLAGVALIVFVRPYSLIPVLGGVLMMLLFKLALLWKNHRSTVFRRTVFLQLLLAFLAGVATWMAPRTGADEQGYAQWHNKVGVGNPQVRARDAGHASYAQWHNKVGVGNTVVWQWQPTAWVPRIIEHYVEVMARTRAGLIDEGLKIQAGSLYDIDVLPASTPQVAVYAPRALQIALFAPFPSRWFEKLSPTRLVALGETAIWYLVAPGLLLALWLGRSRGMMALLVFSLALLTLYGITIANVGTLYRIRYLYLFLLMLISLAGWLLFFERRGWLPKERAGTTAGENPVPQASEDVRQARSALAGSGIIVAAMTTVTFIGLFIRDVIMARLFGLGSELDAFMIAMVVPMFLVAVFSVPIGTAIVPVFLATRERESQAAAQALARRVAVMFLAAALMLAGVLTASTPHLLEAAGWSLLPEKAARTQAITFWMLAIFVFSGLVTLANGLLNALGHYVVPAAAQSIVPVVAIVVLLLFGSAHGAIVVAIAMFIGQLINLALVYRALAVRGIALLPAAGQETAGTREFITQYLPLVAAAVFMQLAMPVSTAMASMLPEGNVAALGLGNKAILFATGLIGTAITSVVLPYFSRHMAQNRLLDARRELSFLLLAGTVIAIPVTVVLYFLSEPFVRLIFAGGAFGSAEVSLVSRVMAYGILQLPFFVINILLLKFAIAARRPGRVMLAAGIGLAANVLLNLLLMNQLGAPGIALSMTLANAMTAGLMLMLFCRLGDVAWVDMVFIVTDWVLFLTLAICLHYESYTGAIAALFAFVFLAMGEWAMTFRARTAPADS
jgi:murein biosynthesis integral membrane protein MurJ